MVMKSMPTPRIVPAGEFKAKCLKLMDEANETSQAITVTKHGKVVGRFVPARAEQTPFRSIFGRTPGAVLPKESEWRTLRDEWIDEWEQSTERLSKQLTQRAKEQN